MKNILSLAVVGLLSSVSFANAAATGAAPAPVIGIRYACEFEGRGISEHGHQDRDVRCRVEGLLPITKSADGATEGNADANARVNPYGGPIEIKCSDGYRLETEYTAISFQGPNLWINAEKHDKLATVRIKEFNVPGAEVDGRRYEADLLAANSAIIHGEGKCKFEYPLAPPPPAPAAPAAPAVPSMAN